MDASKPRQLNVRSDEAYALATTLARRQNLPTQEVVVRALRDYARADAERRGGMTAEQEASLQQITDLGRRFRRKWKYGEGSDHADLYDEDGLPI